MFSKLHVEIKGFQELMLLRLLQVGGLFWCILPLIVRLEIKSCCFHFCVCGFF